MARRLMTPQQAADHYQVSLRTMRRWIADGQVKVERPGGRTVRVIVDDTTGGDDEEDGSTTRSSGDRDAGGSAE